MSNNIVECQSLDELIKTLEKMGNEGSRIAEKALTAGADIVLSRMKGKIYTVLNRQTGKGQQGLTMSEPDTDKKGKTAVYIGVGSADMSEIFYLKFSEYGSAHESAKPWLRPAWDESIQQAISEMENVVHSELQKLYYKGR